MKKQITLIPPNPKYDVHLKVEQKKVNVAAYCRVSTHFEEQEQNLVAQVDYYTQKIALNPNWNFIEVYADQGKIATAMKHRDDFNRMIKDCYSGKIDVILTKSISHSQEILLIS